MQLLSLFLAFFLAIHAFGLRRRDFASDPLNEKLQALSLLGSHFGLVDIPASYDYVIVGGGTAGLTLARRLSANNTVAVIEAGGFYELNNGNLTSVPSNVVYYLGKKPLFNNPLHDWFQQTTPQSGLGGESVLFSQGRTLGGGSARNFMWYQRGTKGSFQKWADALNDQSYSWNQLLPFLKKSPHFTPPTAGEYPANLTPKYDPSDYDPKGGPLQLSYPRFMSPSSSYIGAALNAIGLKELAGMSGGNILGWTSIVNTLDPTTETRSSSETSFLRDALVSNFNLQVYQSALAKKVLFDANEKAYGVEIQVAGLGSGSVTFTLNATKEVIVSAGAFRSPQLLMTSGIGPAKVLRANNISVLADRPGVGQGMWDHVWVGITHEINLLTSAELGDPAFAAAANAEYVANRTGIDTNVAGQILSFEKLPKDAVSAGTRRDLDAAYGADWPDVEYFHIDAYAGDNDDLLLGAPDVRNYTTLAAALVAPFSRGNVSIASADTAVHPLVDPAWLTDPRDVEVFLAAFKRVRQAFASKAMRPVLVGNEVYPGPNVTSDAQIRAAIRESLSTVYHPAGTCKMGRSNDTMAVLDSKARVFGVNGLRVVDASAFPLLPPGHPQSTVYGLAEKIAQDILNGQ